MTMNKATMIAAVVSLTVSVLPIQAQTYQWKDSSGKTVISDTPPPGNVGNARAIGVNRPKVETEKPAENGADKAKGDSKAGEPMSLAEKDAEFKKRQQAAQEKAEKQRKEEQAAEERLVNCERARGQLAALQAGQPLAQFNAHGQAQPINQEQRQQEILRLTRYLEESCK